MSLRLWAAYIACTLIWGLNFVVIRMQGEPVPVEISLFYRSLGACLLFILAIAVTRRTLLRQWRNASLASLFGLCNFMGGYLCLYYAANLISPALVTMVFTMKLVSTPLALGLFRQALPGRNVFLGGFIGAGAVLLLLSSNLTEQNSALLPGLMLAVLGTLITSLGDVVSARNARAGLDPYATSFQGLVATSVLLALIILWRFPEALTLPDAPSYYLALGFLTLLSSFGAWIIYLTLIARIGPLKANFMVAFFPLIAGVASVLQGSQPLTPTLIIACILSGVGACLALKGKKQPRQPIPATETLPPPQNFAQSNPNASR